VSTAEIVTLPDGRPALVRYFPDVEPASSLPNPPIPVYIGPPLLGQLVTLALRDKEVKGVCVTIHRRNGVVFLAPARARRENGTWSTAPGPRVPYVREEILRITITAE